MNQVKKAVTALVVALLLASWGVPAGAADHKVNINTATKEELMTLKYIGEKYADRIIEYRSEQEFSRPEDIMNVKGIGEKTYEANKDMITVTD